MSKWIGWACLGLLLGVVSLGIVVPRSSGEDKPEPGAPKRAEGPAAPKWEYLVSHDKLETRELNKLGAEGWELIAVTGERPSRAASEYAAPGFYFKRRK